MVAEKLHAGSRGLTAENFALFGKLRQFWRKIYSLPIFNSDCIKSQNRLGVPPNSFGNSFIPCRSATHLLICGGVSKLHTSGLSAISVEIFGFFQRLIF